MTTTQHAIALLVRPAVEVPDTAPGEAVRDAFARNPLAGSVVLVDAARRPVGFLDRNRYMLAVSARYGHALYAGRPARKLAEAPRTVDQGTDPADALERWLTADGRGFDDIVVVDDAGACAGIVRVAELVTTVVGA
jgi:hypothetical protein